MMPHKHRGFWLDLLTKIGVPVFAGSLVACLLQEEVKPIHITLMGLGLIFTYLGHRLEYHGGSPE